MYFRYLIAFPNSPALFAGCSIPCERVPVVLLFSKSAFRLSNPKALPELRGAFGEGKRPATGDQRSGSKVRRRRLLIAEN